MEQENQKKKKNRSFDIFLALLILGVVVGTIIYSRGLAHANVSINGIELTTNMTVQEVVDAGFAIDDSMSGRGDVDLSKYPDIPGESYTSTFYYLFALDEYGYYIYSNVIIQVYNPDVNSADFKDCQIYSLRYNPSYGFGRASVLVNDVDFTDFNKEEAVIAMEEMGVKFDADDKAEFLSGEIGILIGKSGNYSYYIETDYDDETIINIQIRRNI